MSRESFELPDLSHVYSMTLAPAADPIEALALYRNDPHVEWIQIDHENVLNDLESIPDDPFFTSSGSWDQPYADLWGLHRIRASEAWPISRGDGVIVAVVDTGLDYHHPDIAENVWVNPGEDLDGNGRVDPWDLNGIDDDDNGFVDDLRGFDFGNSIDANDDGDYLDPEDVSDADPFDANGHGTHVAGTIAAIESNGIGIVGVAPEATLMPVQGFDDNGSGRDSVLWRAVLYAAENGASVINTSWSCRATCPENPLGEEVSALVRSMDVVIVTSAGNNQVDVVYKSPENRRQVITVGSSGQDDRLSWTFSNFGYSVDLAAPGGGPPTDADVFVERSNILSLRSSADTLSEPLSVGEGYSRRSGTSMAAPHVAGVVALLRSAEPWLRYEEIRSILRRHSADLGPEGHDRELGAGRLDAVAVLTHGPVQDVVVDMRVPRPAAILRPQDGDFPILGSALGEDLVEYRLSYGIGTEPTIWHDFAGPTGRLVDDGELGIFPASSLGEGAYVIRAEAVAGDGSVSVEFLPISLERNTPIRISSEGPAAVRPQLLGGRVIWHSRRDPTDPTVETDDHNLFATSIATGREWVVQSGPGNQTSGALGWGIAAWLDDRLQSGRTDLYACRLFGSRGPCDPVLVEEGPFSNLAPTVVGRHVYWTSSDLEIHGCTLSSRGAECKPIPDGLGLGPGRRSLLSTDGRRLAWWNLPPSIGLSICRVMSRSGLCRSEDVVPVRVGGSFPAASGRFAAWTTFGGLSGDTLWVCELNPANDTCPRFRVPQRVFDGTPRLAGNRLVFEAKLPDQQRDVFLCEYDSILGECPIQRLTAAATAQRAATVDGDWVVWEDDRAGQTQIFGIALPRLRVPRERRVIAGQRVVIPVFAKRFRDTDLALTIEQVGGDGLEELGARFVDRGHGMGRLIWRPRIDQVGEYDLLLTARTTSGLYTRAHLRIDVGHKAKAPAIRQSFWKRFFPGLK